MAHINHGFGHNTSNSINRHLNQQGPYRPPYPPGPRPPGPRPPYPPGPRPPYPPGRRPSYPITYPIIYPIIDNSPIYIVRAYLNGSSGIARFYANGDMEYIPSVGSIIYFYPINGNISEYRSTNLILKLNTTSVSINTISDLASYNKRVIYNVYDKNEASVGILIISNLL